MSERERTPLEIIRKKKTLSQPLAGWELVIWEAFRKGYDDTDFEQMALAETAAHEVAAKDARIAELEERVEELDLQVQHLSDAIKVIR